MFLKENLRTFSCTEDLDGRISSVLSLEVSVLL